MNGRDLDWGEVARGGVERRHPLCGVKGIGGRCNESADLEPDGGSGCDRRGIATGIERTDQRAATTSAGPTTAGRSKAKGPAGAPAQAARGATATTAPPTTRQ